MSIITFVELGRREHRKGKVCRKEFIYSLSNELFKRGVETSYVKGPYRLSRATIGESYAVVAVYNEDLFQSSHEARGLIESDYRALIEKAAAADYKGEIWNDLPKTSLLGSKILTHEIFKKNGIPVPERLFGSSSRHAFSVSAFGCHQPVDIIKPGENLPDNKINTAMIDTRVEYNGKKYYTSLRVFCLCDEVLGIYVRARPESDGDPSVHVSDTPIDGPLISHLYNTIAKPGLPQIEAIAKKAYGALGPGFYTHDLLYCANTGELLVCESGIKIGNPGYRKRFMGLSGNPDFSEALNFEAPVKAAEYIVRVMRSREHIIEKRPSFLRKMILDISLKT